MPQQPDRELAREVLNLRRAGVPFDRIADEFNITPTAAKALFDAALGTYDPDFQRVLEADRFDRLHAAVWPQALQGNLEAVDRLVRISERRERIARVPKDNEHAFRQAFDQSVDTSAEIRPDVDAALIAAGRKIADRVDEATATAEGTELTKALYLVPHMLNVLRELLATPAARQASQAAEKEPEAGPTATSDRLAQLRAIHGGKSTA